ncbi:unnamed protein product, partial [Didymodactylos carnosus]
SDDDGQNSSEISYQALKYASDNSLALVKIVCEPKLQKQNQGMAVIQQLFRYIEVDFRRNYPHLGTKALGFEHWWIKRNGDLMGVTKCIDVYVYLCDSKHCPLSINNIQLKPILPKHLPVQLSMMIKFVDNCISVDEVKTELEGQFTKMFAIVDIFGSKNMRNRHVRMDLASKTLTIPTYKQHQEFSLKMKLINDELEEIKREHAKDKISFKRRYDNQLKKTNQEIDILKTQIKIQNETIKDMYTAVIEIVSAIHQTIIALGGVIEIDNSDNDNESIQLNYNKILHELSKTSEMVLDRTDLLQKLHEKLMGVMEKQNELLVTSLVEISDTENV